MGTNKEIKGQSPID